jgi:hypothetical protein
MEHIIKNRGVDRSIKRGSRGIGKKNSDRCLNSLRILSYKGGMEENRQKIERKCVDCGNVFSIDMRSYYRWLRHNKGRDPLDYSCAGCHNKRARTHGGSGTKLHNRWKGLFARTKHSKIYVQKGIKVCPEWYDFAVFKRWAMKNGFKPELHLDRVDNAGDYSPSNCRWITHKENAAKVWTDRDKATIEQFQKEQKTDAA